MGCQTVFMYKCSLEQSMSLLPRARKICSKQSINGDMSWKIPEHRQWLSVTQGRMQDFSGGGPNFKISGILDIQCIIHARSCELLLGGFGACPPPPPKKIFKNGAISCVLRAIFNHFHGKKSFQKFINEHEFFH